jgi:putative ABC transport system permease protein
VKLLLDQITSGARTVLPVLLATSGLVFIIACSNVANLILARTVRREGELRSAWRWAQAEARCASTRCTECAADGGHPGRYASRFSVRALHFRVDSSLLWVGAALAILPR